MNIFYLAHNPVEAARSHLDKHVVKMILEYAQLLSTAHRVLDGKESVVLSQAGRKKKVWQLEDPSMDGILYNATHMNHPSAIWARKAKVNYDYLYALFVSTCDEYTHRYGKVHLTDSKLREKLSQFPKNIYSDDKLHVWHGPTPAMPDECKVAGDHIASYRKYYIDKKANIAKWTNREPPEWFINGIKEKDAYVCVPVQEVRALFRKSPKDVGKRRSSVSTVSGM
jgi:hypothetical protein